MISIRNLIALYRLAKKFKAETIGQRILFLCKPATAYGGGQQYLYRILEAMEGRNSINIVFAFPYFKSSDDFIKEISSRGAKGLTFQEFTGRYWSFFQWIIIVLAFKPSIMHINGYHSGTRYVLILGLLLKKYLNFKIIITQHLSLFSEDIYKLINDCNKNILKILSPNNYRWWMREYYEKKTLLRFADKLIFVDLQHKRLYQKFLNLTASKAITIVNGVNTEIFTPFLLNKNGRDNLRQSFGVQENDFLIIGVGNLIHQKRFDIFIKVIAKLTRIGYPVKAFIVGGGPNLSDLEKIAVEENCNKSIHFLGYRDDIPSILNIGDLFLMTSDDEGMPYALLEAKSCGLPAVATSVGGIREVINNKVDGFVVPPRDIEKIVLSIKMLIDEPLVRERMGEIAREDVLKRFSLKHMQYKTMKVFKSFDLRKN